MITSAVNPKVKEIIQLQKKAAVRKNKDVYIVEGVKMYEEADPGQIQKIYVSEGYLRKHPMPVQNERGQWFCEEVSDKVMEAMSDTKTPQGILCVMKRRHYRLEDMLRAERQPRLLLLENLQDPGNLGTIMRTAEGAGMAGVILTENCVDMYNPKTIRSTMGSLYRVPFIYLQDDSLEELCAKLKRKGLILYGSALRKDSVSYDAVSYRQGCVFMIGNEAAGLSDLLLNAADQLLHIPMSGKVESLNASVAAAILMYESRRQSRGRHDT